MIINTDFGLFLIRQNIYRSNYQPVILKGQLFYVCNSQTFYKILFKEKGLTEDSINNSIYVASEYLGEVIDELVLEARIPKNIF